MNSNNVGQLKTYAMALERLAHEPISDEIALNLITDLANLSNQHECFDGALGKVISENKEESDLNRSKYRVVSSEKNSETVTDEQRSFLHRELLLSGLVKQIKQPKITDLDMNWQPIPVNGKPMSEMIIEDRR
jgi:hypothetical protein